MLESFVSKERDKAAALKFIIKALKRHGSPRKTTIDGLRSYKAAMKEIGNTERFQAFPRHAAKDQEA